MSGLRWMVAAALVAVVAVAVGAGAGTAGGTDPEPDDGIRTVAIDIRYSHFGPDAIRVALGEPIRIVLANGDPIDHEWIVGDDATHARHRTGTEPVHDARPTEVSVPAGATVETVVTFDAAGTYAFVCHLPGHEAYGMVGTVVVGDG